MPYLDECFHAGLDLSLFHSSADLEPGLSECERSETLNPKTTKNSPQESLGEAVESIVDGRLTSLQAGRGVQGFGFFGCRVLGFRGLGFRAQCIAVPALKGV